LCRETGSSSDSSLGGMSVRASRAAVESVVTLAGSLLFISNSIAALRLNASIRQVSLSTALLPTERTSTPSVLVPTDSSGWFRMPLSMISAIVRSAGPYCFMR